MRCRPELQRGSNPELVAKDDDEASLATFNGHAFLPSFCAAVAGGVMVTSLRATYVVGPLMIRALIPAAALVGASLSLGDFALAGRAAAHGALEMGSGANWR